MADNTLPPFEFDDTKPPAVLGKMDALIARHRGNGPDPNVPVLTDLAPANTGGDIPVLTHVEPLIGDELMFTPEEIRPDEPAHVPPPAPTPAPSSVAARPAAPVVPDMIEVPPIHAVRAPSPPPTAAPDFGFPDLSLPSPTPAPKPAMAAAPAPAVGAPLMPELSLNFDFAVPEERKVAPAPAPVAVPAPAVPPVVVAPAPAPVVAPDMMFGDVELTIDAPPFDAVDAAAIADAVHEALRPEFEKLVRAELAKQLAPLHAEALRRTMGVLLPQFEKMITAHVDAEIKRRQP